MKIVNSSIIAFCSCLEIDTGLWRLQASPGKLQPRWVEEVAVLLMTILLITTRKRRILLLVYSLT